MGNSQPPAPADTTERSRLLPNGGDLWVIDSGAPRHMCHSYRSGAQTRSDPDGGVTSASGHHLSTLGYVDLGTPLSNVQVVPNIKWNLFSVPQYLLDQGGGGVLFTKDSVISIPSNDTTLADLERNGPLLGQRHSRSYILYHRRANGDVVPAMPHLQPRPEQQESTRAWACLLYTSPSPRDS